MLVAGCVTLAATSVVGSARRGVNNLHVRKTRELTIRSNRISGARKLVSSFPVSSGLADATCPLPLLPVDWATTAATNNIVVRVLICIPSGQSIGFVCWLNRQAKPDASGTSASGEGVALLSQILSHRSLLPLTHSHQN